MTSELHDLWRERQEIGAALDSGLLADDDPAWERFPDLDEAIRKARPTDPAGLAIQMRLLADEFAASGLVADEKLALRIATALEKLGQAGQHGKPDSSVDFVQAPSDRIAAPAQRPPLRPAETDYAGRGRPRRLDRLPGNRKAPGARRFSAEQFVSKAAALVWTINIWVIIARAWWMRCRAAPARDEPQPAHIAAVLRTGACGPSFSRPQGLALTADPAGRSP